MFLSILLLLTIIFAFSLGIALGYWAIFAILDFFDPARFRTKERRAPELATTAGD